MTTSAQLNTDNLSLSNQQIEQLRLLEVNHHLIPASLFCQSGSLVIHMDHGVFSKEIKQTVFWAHIHAVGAITSPQDNDHYSLEVDDGSTRIFFAPDIVVGQQLTFDYSPGFSVDITITLKCITNPNKTADITVEGQVCVG